MRERAPGVNPPVAYKGSVPPLPEEYISSRSGMVIRPNDPAPVRDPVEDIRDNRDPRELVNTILDLRRRVKEKGYEVRKLSFDLDNADQQIAEYERILGNGQVNGAGEFMRRNHDRDFLQPRGHFIDPDPGDAIPERDHYE